MNILAHALLGAHNDDLMLGSMLGDFVHGPVPQGLRPDVEAGVRLHRAVDVYTDAHPIVRELRGTFVAPFRRYAGIILDIWFDHLLARDFARYSDVPLAAFSDRVMQLLRAHADELPPSMHGFVAYMARYDLPAGYAERTAIARAFAGVASRLARANPIADSLTAIDRNAAAIADGFAQFFPQLQAYARAQTAQA
ncbi:MAG TPA: ACP phosphodiesterase [Tahibacter sp.]|nr:ACP phosphodiesterase [Tahibacter sp.]